MEIRSVGTMMKLKNNLLVLKNLIINVRENESKNRSLSSKLE